MNTMIKNNNEYDPLQSKVFSRWISSQIKGLSNDKIENITKDLSNGVALIELAESLTHKKAPQSWNRKPNTDIQNVENCNIAIKMFQDDGVKLVGISGKDINDKNEKLIYGLIWSLIMHYSIGNVEKDNENTKKNIKNDKNKNENNNDFDIQENALISWAINRTTNYKNVDYFKPYELAICALLDSFFPEKIHFYSLNPESKQENLKLANDIMSELGIQVFIYNDDIVENNNQINKLALLTQLAAIKSALCNKDGDKKKLDEKESESEWDPETESQTEQISEAEAILEEKQILEELRIKKAEQEAKRKAAEEARREYRNQRKLRKMLVLLKAKEEAKLRSEVAQSRQNQAQAEEDRIKFEEKRIKAEEERIQSVKRRLDDEQNIIKGKMDKINNDEKEIKKEKSDNEKSQLTKNDENKNEDQDSDDKNYEKIITRRQYTIKIGIKSRNIDLSKIKKLNLGIRVDDNDVGNADSVREEGDAYIKLPLSGNEKIGKKNMQVTVKKDGKVIDLGDQPILAEENGEKQIYHVKLL